MPGRAVKAHEAQQLVMWVPALRHNSFSFLYIKTAPGVTLSKDRILFGKSQVFPTAVDDRKECLWIECSGNYHQ